MEKKGVSGITLTLLLIGMLTLALNTQQGKAEGTPIVLVIDPVTFGNYGNQLFKERLIESGYVVTIITHSEITGFDFSTVEAAVVLWDSGYMSQPKDYSGMISSGIGIVFMSADVAKVGLGSSAGRTSYGANINIIHNTHYIASAFSIGSLTVYNTASYRNYISRNADTILLANITDGDIIVVKGRIVYFGLTCARDLNENGWTLFDRSVEWAVSAVPGMSADLVRRAAWPEHHHFVLSKDGDPLIDDRHGTPGYQTLYGMVKNTGNVTLPAETYKVVWSISSSTGLTSILETVGAIDLALGEVTVLTYDVSAIDLTPSKYYVEAQCYYYGAEGEKTKTFSFSVVP